MKRERLPRLQSDGDERGAPRIGAATSSGDACTLTIEIAAADLQTIVTAALQVVVLRQSSAGRQVVWLAFSPFQSNVLTWDDTCSLYAATGTLTPGTVIVPAALVAATAQLEYPFSGGAFQTPQKNPDLPPGTYQVLNAPGNASALVFGTAQTPNLNGQTVSFCPVEAATVPVGFAGMFTPVNELTVMLRSQTVTAQVIDYVPVKAAASVVQGPALVLTFTAATRTQTIRYSAATGAFVPVT